MSRFPLMAAGPVPRCALIAALSLAATVRAQEDTAPPAAAQPAASDQPEIKGYCPASYLLSGQAVQGSPAFKVTYKGKVYHCASAEARKAFEGEPERHLPQFNGLCTTAMGGQFGNFLFADPTVFDVYEGKVYLFSNERAKNVYVKDKNGYIDRAKVVFEQEPKTPRAAGASRGEAGKPGQPQPQSNPLAGMLGQKLPPVDLTLRDGTKVSTADFHEPAILLMFYTSWCPHCRRALPNLEQLSKEPSLTGARFMAVSLDTIVEQPNPKNPREKKKEDLLQQWTELGLTLPLAFLDPILAQGRLNVRTYPTLMLLDGQNKVQRASGGAAGLTNGSTRTDLEALLAGKTLTDAKAPEEEKTSDAPKEALKLIGQAVPEAAFTSALDGSKVTLSGPTDALATVIFFYVTFDKFSNQALPTVNEWVKGYDGKPVRFFGISQDMIKDQRSPQDERIKTRDDVLKHWQGLDLKFPMLFDPEGYGRAKFQVRSFPTVFLVNREGRVEQVYLGLRPIREGKLKQDIDSLLAGSRPAPPAPQSGS